MNAKDVVEAWKLGFWQDVATTWAKINYYESINKAQVMQQPIWLNSFIKADNKILYNKQAAEIGFPYVSQMLDEQGEFLSYQQVKTDSNDTMSHMIFYTIVHIINTQWYRILRAKEPNGMERENLLRIIDCEKVSAEVYPMFINRPNVCIQKCRKWEII